MTSSRRPAVEEVLVDAGDVELSGLLAWPDTAARALVVALPGGGLRAGYFHGVVDPDQSLLTLGAALGFATLALDRPGYGASAASLPDGMGLGSAGADDRRCGPAVPAGTGDRRPAVPRRAVGRDAGGDPPRR